MRKCKVGPVQSVTDDAEFSGWGFIIYDDVNKPRLTRCYSNKSGAEAAHVHVEAALVDLELCGVCSSSGNLAKLAAMRHAHLC